MENHQQWSERALKVEDALRYLHLVTADARLFTDNHPKFQESLKEAYEFWKTLLAEHGTIEIKCVEGDLIYDEMPLQKRLKTTEGFREQLQGVGIECFVVEPGLTSQELLEYARYMRLSEKRREARGGAADYFKNRGVRHIQAFWLGDMSGEGEKKGAEDGGAPVVINDMSSFRQNALKIISEIYRQTKIARVLDLDAAKEIVETFLNQAAANSNLLLGLCAIRSADEYTCTHSMNTCLLSISLARYVGVPEEILPKLGMACLLHDIGKMFVPDEILNKPGRLTPEEWEVMQNHTVYGARFLLAIPEMPKLASVVAFEHHMGLGGSGYPVVEGTYDVNMISLMASVADVYDALSTARSYKRAVPPDQVVDIIRKMDDGKMEPRLKRWFLTMVGKYPIGSVVELDTGELAVVAMQNDEEPLKPKVEVVTKPDGTKLTETYSLDLGENSSKDDSQRTISKGIDPMEVEIDALEVIEKSLRPSVD